MFRHDILPLLLVLVQSQPTGAFLVLSGFFPKTSLLAFQSSISTTNTISVPSIDQTLVTASPAYLNTATFGTWTADQVDFASPAEFIADTKLPTKLGHFRLRAYRTTKTNEFTGNEPCVIYAADKPPFGEEGKLRQDVPVRIHDQCVTSEVLGSQRCDCKEQLEMAMEYVAENGGAVIYTQQEGRGIGLANKVAAYALQDLGLDTVDANLRLGLPEDCRQYGSVPTIFQEMKIGSIQLMTNNPRKVDRLKNLGVEITATVPMVVPETNPHNRRYLEAKHNRMAHANLSSLFHGQVSVEAKEKAGVIAGSDGYCFGRQSVEDAIEAIKQGEMVVVVDDMNRENEGDLIMAADACTPEDMAKIVRYSSGIICVGMSGDRLDALNLPQMVSDNEDPKETAFTVTVDATKEYGISTGISSRERAITVNALANMDAQPTSFHRPGHIFPLRAKEGGVLARGGHTEAAVDLSRLAGRGPAGLLVEIVSEEDATEMARLPELQRFSKEHGLVMTSIVDIAQYRRDVENVTEP